MVNNYVFNKFNIIMAISFDTSYCGGNHNSNVQIIGPYRRSEYTKA